MFENTFERELAEDTALSQIETPFSDDFQESTFEEQYENAEFAQDDDFHNMFADDEGFFTND